MHGCLLLNIDITVDGCVLNVFADIVLVVQSVGSHCVGELEVSELDVVPVDNLYSLDHFEARPTASTAAWIST